MGRLAQVCSVGLWGCSIFGFVATLPQEAIAQTCVAETTCPPQAIQVTPGSWIDFEIINRTGNIIYLEQPSAMAPVALIPGQTIHLGGSTRENASLLFWDIQGLSLQANIQKLAQDKIRVDIVWGSRFGHYALYLKDDGHIEIF